MFGSFFGHFSTDFKDATIRQTQKAVAEMGAQFVDVRTKGEYSAGHAENAVSVPLDTLEQHVGKFDREKPVYVICQSGMRSQRGAAIFKHAGFLEVYNVLGGTGAWISAGLPVKR
jgi:rhodanese-related sulfurtransferase